MTSMENKYILIADSGSTKTDWVVACEGKASVRCFTQGINPFHQVQSQIMDILKFELLATLATHNISISLVTSIRFYGAGCRGEGVTIIQSVLESVFINASTIIVRSDLMAAAHALCGNHEGIACILGTGANSCLYDGNEIVSNVSPLGYILGDEGSGAVLGRIFLNALFKGNLPRDMKDDFFHYSGMTMDDIIRRVYREPMANRWLASISPFIHSHLFDKRIKNLVVGNFVDFFRKNVDHYKRNDLKVGAVGSVSYYYQEQLSDAAEQCGYRLGRIIKSPIDGLIGF